MDELAFKCNYCDRVFCTEHRLPERHDCKALDNPQLFKKNSRSDQDDDDNTSTTVAEVDLESDRHYSEIDVEPMTVSREQTVGSTSKSPISDSSPDVAPDGSLVYSDDDTNEEEANSADSESMTFSRPLIVLVVVLVIASLSVLFLVL
ncbi:MAG TPA: AN1-type zinc finger protein [Natronoarchaeum rubrum]|nr:AN1-type zinc finger protein [Natronoarchaeum rubrum]